MLDRAEIDRLAKDLKIAPLNVIREWAEMEILDQLAQSSLSQQIVFYGGTALRLAFRSFRFSEDLDFFFSPMPKIVPHGKLREALTRVERNFPQVTVAEVREKRFTLFGLMRVTHPILKHALHIKIEINKQQKGAAHEQILVSSPVSTQDVIFRTATLEALYDMKLQAIREREEARDWFDLWYIGQRLQKEPIDLPKFPFARKEFTRELRRWLPHNKWESIDMAAQYFDRKYDI